MSRHVRRQVPASSRPNRVARNAHARARQEFATYDTSAISPPKKELPRFLVPGIIALVVVLLLIFVIIPFFTGGDNKGSLEASQTATVTIESGDSAKDVASKFQASGLVANADKFASKLAEVGADSSLIPGDYTFSGKTDTTEMAQALKDGKRDEGDKVTVVEGYTVAATADAVESATSGAISSDTFAQACSDASKFAADYDFLKDVGNKSLEGFLLPKTYEIEDNETAESLIKKMLTQFKTETSGLDFSYATNAGLNMYDAVKLASVVEKEASTEYHTRVAGIFYNRLKSDSPYLQSDATTAYYVGHDPSGEEVHANNEYSTYTNPGLPPTPICNPSIDSIKSVCFPEDNNYRYFYTMQDGTYVFSETYEQHQQAIAQDSN